MLPPCKLGHWGWILRGSEAVLAGANNVTRFASPLTFSTAMSSTQPLIRTKRTLMGQRFCLFRFVFLPEISQDHGSSFTVTIGFGRPLTDHVPFGSWHGGDRHLFVDFWTEFSPFRVENALLNSLLFLIDWLNKRKEDERNYNSQSIKQLSKE